MPMQFADVYGYYLDYNFRGERVERKCFTYRTLVSRGGPSKQTIEQHADYVRKQLKKREVRAPRIYVRVWTEGPVRLVPTKKGKKR